MFVFDAQDNEFFDGREGQCQACDQYGPVDDLMLCENCSAMFERDLIRQRAWDYSASAFGLRDEAREALRRQVIAEYGEDLEMIEPGEGL